MLLLFLQFDSECNARANLTQSSLLVLLRCSRVSPTVKSLSIDLKMKTRFSVSRELVSHFRSQNYGDFLIL